MREEITILYCKTIKSQDLGFYTISNRFTTTSLTAKFNYNFINEKASKIEHSASKQHRYYTTVSPLRIKVVLTAYRYATGVFDLKQPLRHHNIGPLSLSTHPLFCCEFVEIASKVLTTGDLKNPKEREWLWGKTGIAAAFPPLSLFPAMLPHRPLARSKLVAKN